MGELIVLDDYRQQWREALKVHTDASTLSLFVNARTGEAEIVQTNDEGESISTSISSDIVELFREALQPKAGQELQTGKRPRGTSHGMQTQSGRSGLQLPPKSP